MADYPYRVKLVSRAPQPPFGYNKVTFEVSPELVESRTVNYSSQDPVHMPGQIFVYKNTQARTFNISGAKLISRTPAEAENTLQKLRILRGWTMPRFGINSQTSGAGNQQDQQDILASAQKIGNSIFIDQSLLQPQGTGELLGSPPEVLYFSAYSNSINDTNAIKSFRGQLYNIPVVIQSLSIPYPTDVDYIISSPSQAPIPLIMAVDIQLIEAHSAQEYEQFNLNDFKQGNLAGF